MMNNETNINWTDWFNDCFKTYGYSESDIISMYIDGKISKEEYVRRMDDVRGKRPS